MTFNETLDLTLKMLYQQYKANGDRGSIYPMEVYTQNQIPIEEDELKLVINTLKNHGFIVSQISRRGIRIYFDSMNLGVPFVETSSFSSPGTSILKLPVV